MGDKNNLLDDAIMQNIHDSEWLIANIDNLFESLQAGLTANNNITAFAISLLQLFPYVISLEQSDLRQWINLLGEYLTHSIEGSDDAHKDSIQKLIHKTQSKKKRHRIHPSVICGIYLELLKTIPFSNSAIPSENALVESALKMGRNANDSKCYTELYSVLAHIYSQWNDSTRANDFTWIAKLSSKKR